jgi:hypothetical protein
LFFFAFACYSAGTPRLDDFSHLQHDSPRELAGKPFVARLPERLLALGALAFIGHVDRAWDFSFLGVDGASSVSTYQSTLEAILKGKPVGHALEYFGDRYADLAHEITDTHEDSLLHKFNLLEPVEPIDLARLWTAHNDARAYVLFGDPFARLRPSLMSAPGDVGEK